MRVSRLTSMLMALTIASALAVSDRLAAQGSFSTQIASLDLADGADDQLMAILPDRTVSAAVADLDGDGFVDLAYGIEDDDQGRILVFFGPFSQMPSESSPDLTVEMGDASVDSFGARVALAPDMNGDGLQELRVHGHETHSGSTLTWFISVNDGAVVYESIDNVPLDPWLTLDGDADSDGDVDQQDLDRVLQGQGILDPLLVDGDVTRDGVIDSFDISLTNSQMNANAFGQLVQPSGCADLGPNEHCVDGCDDLPLGLPMNVVVGCDRITCEVDPAAPAAEVCELCSSHHCSTGIVGPSVVQVGETVVFEAHMWPPASPLCGDCVVWTVCNCEHVTVVGDVYGDELVLHVDDAGPPIWVALYYGHCATEEGIQFDGCTATHTTHVGLVGDSDGDGVCDVYENVVGTDPFDEESAPSTSLDSDADGLTDVDEVCNQGTDPNDSDSDNDGLTDGLEVSIGLSPTAIDTDRNGVSDADEDLDGDGLSNLDEVAFGADPLVADTDGDGISDGDEVGFCQDPTNGDDADASIVRFRARVGADPATTDVWSVTIGPHVVVSPRGGTSDWHEFSLPRSQVYDVFVLPVSVGNLETSEPQVDIDLDLEDAGIDDLGAFCRLINGELLGGPWAPGEIAQLVAARVRIGVDADSSGDLCTTDMVDLIPGFGYLSHRNTGDADLDSIPDYADGYNFDNIAGTDDDLSESDELLPLVIEIETLGLFDQIVFEYGLSDPSAITLLQAEDGPYFSVPHAGSSGGFRIWTKNGHVARIASSVEVGGDLVAPDTPYLLSDFGLPPNGGSLTVWLEVVGSVTENINDIQVRAVGLPGDATAEVTALNVQMAPLLAPSFPFPTPVTPPVSQPSPVISLTEFELHSPRVDPETGELIGDLHLAGTIDDAASDLVPGIDGIINQIELSLDGAPLVVVDSTSPVVITLADAEVTKQEYGGNVFKPYDFDASFSRVIESVRLQPGWQKIAVSATNRFGYSGESTKWFRIQTLAPPDERFEITLDFLDVHPYFATECVFSLSRDGVYLEQDVVLTSTKPGTFRDPTDLIVIAGLSPDMTVSPTQTDEFVFLLDHESTGLLRSVVAQESEIDSLIFEGDTVLEEHGRDDWTDFDFSVSHDTAIAATNGGSFNPFLMRIHTDADLTSGFEVLFDYEDDELDDRVYSVVPYTCQFHGNCQVLARPGTGHPEVFLSVPLLDEWLADEFGEVRSGVWNYAQGFGQGLADTGMSLVDSVGELAKFVCYTAFHYNNVAVFARFIGTGNILRPTDKRRLTVTWEFMQEMAAIAQELLVFEKELVVAILSGDPAALVGVSVHYALAFEFSIELIDAARAEIDWMDDYSKGRLIGRIIGEVALEIGLALTSSGAANAARKSEVMSGAITKLNSAPDDLIPLAVKQNWANLSGYISKLSSSCFVAGTLVSTVDGLVPIEQIKVGDLVLAKDEERGDIGLQPVQELFVTRPTVLVQITYQCESGETDAITSSLEHPYFDSGRQRFVPASDLVPGDQLECEDGTVLVSEVKRQYATQGQSFTTYNIRVSNWQTYFVSPHRLWVHNASTQPCQRAWTVYTAETVKFGASPNDAFDSAIDSITQALSALPKKDRLQHFGDLATLALRETGDLGPTDKLWTSRQGYTNAQNAAEHWYKHAIEYLSDPAMQHPLDHPLDYFKRAIQFRDELGPSEDVITAVCNRNGKNVKIKVRISTREFFMVNEDDNLVRTLFRANHQIISQGYPRVAAIDPSDVAAWLRQYVRDQGVIGPIEGGPGWTPP